MNLFDSWGAFDRFGFQAMRLLLTALWQSSILLAAVGALAWLLRKRAASVRHAFWVGGLILAPLLPLLAAAALRTGAPQAPVRVLPVYVAPAPVSYAPEPAAPVAVAERAPAVPAVSAPKPAPRSILGFPWALALAGYLAGVAAFLAWFIACHLRIRHWIRSARPLVEERVISIFKAARRDARMTRDFVVLESAGVPTPVSFGALHPAVLLPKGLAGRLTDAELRALAIHELAHLRRRDAPILSLLALVRGALFFHPLVWLATRQAAALAEQAADDAVLDATGEPLPYAKLLARLAEELPRRAFSTELATGIVFSRNAFLRRVEAILSDRAKVRRLSRWALAATLTAAVISIVFSCSVPLATHQAEVPLPSAWAATHKNEGDLSLAEGEAALIGRIFAPDGSPAAEAEVHVRTRELYRLRAESLTGKSVGGVASQVTKTDKEGVFRLKLPVHPSWETDDVGTQEPQLLLTVSAWVPDKGASFPQAMTLEAGRREKAAFRLCPVGEVTGAVLDEQGKPVHGATVELSADDISTGVYAVPVPHGFAVWPLEEKTGDDGSFRFGGVLPGRYSITASAPGRVRILANPGDGELNVTPGKTGRQEILLIKDHAVRGRVLDLQGRPMSDADLRYNYSGGGGHFLTNGDGGFDLDLQQTFAPGMPHNGPPSLPKTLIFWVTNWYPNGPASNVAEKLASRAELDLTKAAANDLEIRLERTGTLVIDAREGPQRQPSKYVNVSFAKADEFRFPAGEQHRDAILDAYKLRLPCRDWVEDQGTGQLVIEGVPPGEYEIYVWHGDVHGARATVAGKTRIAIRPGDTVRLDPIQFVSLPHLTGKISGADPSLLSDGALELLYAPSPAGPAKELRENISIQKDGGFRVRFPETGKFRGLLGYFFRTPDALDKLIGGSVSDVFEFEAADNRDTVLELALHEALRLRVTVVEPDGATICVPCRVTIAPESDALPLPALTRHPGEKGICEFGPLPAGKYVVSVSLEGDPAILAKQQVTLQPGDKIRDLKITLPAASASSPATPAELAAPAEPPPDARASEPPWSEAVNGLQSRIVPEKRLFKRGEPIVVRVEVRNATDKPVQYDGRVPQQRSPFFDPNYEIILPNGMRAFTLLESYQTTHDLSDVIPPRYEYPTLKPGETIVFCAPVRIGEGLYVLMPGRYRVRWSGTTAQPAQLKSEKEEFWAETSQLVEGKSPPKEPIPAVGLPPCEAEFDVLPPAPGEFDVDVIAPLLKTMPPNWLVHGAHLFNGNVTPTGFLAAPGAELGLVHRPELNSLMNNAWLRVWAMKDAAAPDPATKEKPAVFLGQGPFGFVYLSNPAAEYNAFGRWNHAAYDIAVALGVKEPAVKKPEGPDWGRMVSCIMADCWEASRNDLKHLHEMGYFCDRADLKPQGTELARIAFESNFVPGTMASAPARKEADTPYYSVSLSVRPPVAAHEPEQRALGMESATDRIAGTDAVRGYLVKRLGVEIAISVITDDEPFRKAMNEIINREVTRALGGKDADSSAAASLPTPEEAAKKPGLSDPEPKPETVNATLEKNAGEAVNGLKVILSAEKAVLTAKPGVENEPLAVEPTRLTIAFKNTGDKPIKVETWLLTLAQAHLVVVGPEKDSVSVVPMPRIAGPFREKGQYQVIESGRILTLKENFSFPKFPNEKYYYRLHKAGEYKLQLVYAPGNFAHDAEAEGVWRGKVVSNTLTIRVEMEQASAPAEKSATVQPPKELTLDCGKDVSLKLVLIPAGEFMMGGDEPPEQVLKKYNGMAADPKYFQNEQPQHRVKLTKPFYMGVYVVTQAQYEAVMGNNPSHFKGDGNLPVEEVYWNDAVEFCKKLSAKTGQTVRLPTEAGKTGKTGDTILVISPV